MADLIEQSFTDFFQQLTAANQTLLEQQGHITDRKEGVLALLKGLTLPTPPTGDSVYHQACRTALGELETQLVAWTQGVKARIEKAEFVNRHEKSILTVVFADVKAGKSTLGNFVSGYYLQNTPYSHLYQPLEYHVEDFSQASQESRDLRTQPMPFFENAIEATSTIQYYTLSQGLTWVDTPGLHSLTSEHGDLAKEYVEFADLVLFLSSSTSPMKADEREMLGGLLRQGKAVMVVITKSDETKRVIKDGALAYATVPKSQENRKQQEQYFTTMLNEMTGKHNVENKRVVSTSTKLAQHAVADGAETAFAQSNLPVFFHQMGDIFSQKAIELKMRRPKTELNHCIDVLLGQEDATKESLSAQRTRLQGLIAELEDVLQKRQATTHAIVSQLEVRMPNVISLALRTLRAQQVIDDAEKVRQTMAHCISDTCSVLCVETYQEEFKANKLPIALPAVNMNETLGGGYQKTYVTQEVCELTERSAKNIFEKFEKWVDKDKIFYASRLRKERVETGDNFSSFIQQNWEGLRPVVKEYVEATVDAIYDQCIMPLHTQYKQTDAILSTLEQALEKLKF